jgi:hypothetical protein
VMRSLAFPAIYLIHSSGKPFPQSTTNFAIITVFPLLPAGFTYA